MKKTILYAIALAATVACSQAPESTSTPTMQADGEPGATNLYAAAVAHSGRTDSDRLRDTNRKPADILAFFGIEPGMTVLDMFSGGGYYTELLSHLVGPTGKVIAHNNQAYVQYVGEEATNRYANSRLANVDILLAENNQLDLPGESLDAIMMILAYHDIYYVDPQNGWPKIDGPRLMGEFFDGLKPGGLLAIVDHTAATGSPRETGNTLHRIDPDIVISELGKAGFVLDAESDVLRNVDDDLSMNMSAPEIRGRTDRFVMRFRKPK